jgi:hypothetical protein
MPRRSWISFAVVLLLTLSAAAASAQRRPMPLADFRDATQRLAQQAALEAPRSQLARAARQLASVSSVRGPELERAYLYARRMLVSDRQIQPSDALLDAWDDVAASYAPIRHRAPMPTPPPPVHGSYSFEGRFEQTPVRLSGRTLEELEQQCLRFTGAIDTRNVDDVTIGTRSVRNGPSYWDAQALCSIVVLNASTARSYAPVHTNGSIEGIPFAVSGTRDVVEQVIARHVPRLARSMRIDDVEILGQHYRNGPSYWSGEQVVSMIVAQLPPGGIVGPYSARQGA